MSTTRSQANIYVDTGQAVEAYERLLSTQAKVQKDIDRLRDKERQLTDDLAQNITKREQLIANGSKKEAKELNAKIKEQKAAIAETTEALKQKEQAFKDSAVQADRLQRKINGTLSPSYRDLSNTVTKLRRELSLMSEQDAGFDTKRTQLAQAQAQLQQYSNSITGLKSQFMGLASQAKGIAVGITLGGLVEKGINLVLGAVRAVFSVRTEFQNQIQNLSAITGATGQDLEFLKSKAIELSTTSSKSASDFVEAMKFIASAKPELLSAKEDLAEVTRQADRLAKASGLDLPDASKRLTDALNQFGAPASDAAKYVDALAAASKFGAAEVPEVTESLVQFGATAKASNIDIYESAAAIELMAEKGVKGAEAGTKLRNVFIAMAAADTLDKKALKALEQADVDLNKLKDSSLTLEERLTELGKIGNNTSAIVEVFGKENAVAAQIVLQNIPRYAELNQQIREQGAASDAASANTNTLTNAWAKFKNTLVSLFLSFDLTPITTFVNKLKDGVEWFGRLTGAIKSNSQLLEQERYQLQLTTTNITSLAVGTKERTKMLDELKERYPDLLRNLDSERDGNDKVREAIDKVNSALIQKIALAAKEEELSEQLDKQGKAAAKLAETRVKMGQELTHILNQNSAAINEYNSRQLDDMTLTEKAGALLSGAIKLRGTSKVTLGELQRAYDNYREALAKNNEEQDKSNELLRQKAEFEEQLRAILGSPAPTTPPDATSEPTAPGAPASPTAAPQLPDYAAAYKNAIQAAQQATEQLKLLTKQQYADQLISASQYSEALKLLDLDLLNAKLATALAFKGKVEGIENEILQLETAIQNKKLDLRIEGNAQAQKATEERAEHEREQYAEEDALASEMFAKRMMEMAAIRQARQEAHDEMRAQMQEAHDDLQMYGGASINLMTSMFQIANNLDAQELSNHKVMLHQKKDALKMQLDAGLISEKDYKKKVSALEDDYRKKEREAKKKAWERQKAASIVSAIINTALSVMNALATMPYPASIVMAALAGATGAAQIGIIASQPVPEFAEGGIVQGPSHAEGGIAMMVGGKKIGELEGNELIASKKFVSANPDLVEPILQASRDGGRLIDYLPNYAPLPNAINTARATENIYMERGGLLSAAPQPAGSASGSSNSSNSGNAAPASSKEPSVPELLTAINNTLARIEANTEIDYYKLARSMNEIKSITELQL